MLEFALLLVPMVAAVAAGWLLGRFQRRPASPSHIPPGRDYYRGLHQLIHDKTDEAIESFIRALEINSDTIPAYLALADLFRRKGEYERAIELHQTLLARSDLIEEDFIRIQLSLAKDYQAVGLFDRAEGLLQSVITEHPRDEQRHTARRQLAKLYEIQQEWELALKTALKLPDSKRADVAHEMAQYACQLAETVFDLPGPEAENWLKQALKLDPTCVRANLMLAEHRMQRHAWRGAIKHLKEVADQDPRMIPETLSKLSDCYRELGNLEAYSTYLDQCLAKHPSATAVVERAQQLAGKEGVAAAIHFMIPALKKHPSVAGFHYLLELQLQQGETESTRSLEVLRELTQQLTHTKPDYRCQQCGYESKTLYWQCPSCKSWNTTGVIQGLEGE
ncbi:MAG: lipopolysaccharide assembly protein LapB [Nitrincola lacisaponensis]|uniref:lipopolysaccharide assembly protein LapB n=1 Tax=Nitrincola lacisaponensis TaxID=267850 RepID=UPI00391BE556